MKKRQTHYEILGVKPDVSSAEIKRAYRNLVKDHHPDKKHSSNSAVEKNKATEAMMRLNEAYETLKDRKKRARYDALIGLTRTIGTLASAMDSMDEDKAREAYLQKVFHPTRRSISRVLSKYEKQLRKLSLDLFDDEHIAAFETYVDQVEQVLARASNDLSSNESPRSLDSAVQMLRYSIAQAADGMEEMRRFCQNFDYNHLTMAENLFAISADLSRQSLALTRG